MKRKIAERSRLELPSLPFSRAAGGSVEVVRGVAGGATLLVVAALHGDEWNGIEIANRLLRTRELDRLSGTLLVVPIANPFGVFSRSRRLSDGRDLNRAFPGRIDGAPSSRWARILRTEVLEKATHLIDLHTAPPHRTNLPQIRARLDGDGILHLAKAFGVSVVLDAPLRPGSLRKAAHRLGIPALLYEGGAGLRFDEPAIRAGVRGILSVMKALRMLPGRPLGSSRVQVSRASRWIRTPHDGIVRRAARTGSRIEKGAELFVVEGDRRTVRKAPFRGVVIGRNDLPIVREGEAILHLAKL